MSNAPEFSRRFAVEDIPDEGRAVALEADESERAALARRYKIAAVGRLSMTGGLTPWGGSGVRFSGTLSGEAVQTCGVTLEPVAETLEIPVERSFHPDAGVDVAANANREVELDPDEDIVDPLTGGTVDLGEVAAEEFALALSPYPRAPGVAFEGGDAAEGEDGGPFAALKRLKQGGGNGST